MIPTNVFRLMIACLLALLLFSPSAQAQRKKQLAVLDFDFATVDIGLANRAYGGQKNLARRVADKLITSLVALKTCQVIERSQLEKILKEQNLGLDGRIDPNTAAKIGKVLGVDAIILGNVSVFELRGLPKDSKDTMWSPQDMSARIAVNFRIVDTTTGVVEVSNEMIGMSAQGPKKSAGRRFGEDILNSMLKGDQKPQVKDEHIRDVVQQAVEEAVGKMTLDVERYVSGNLRPPEPTITADKLLNGRVISVSGPSLVINNINKTSVRVGDRLFVRRFKAVRDPVTGKETKFSEKIGEVEVVEIQEELIIGSFSGSGAAQVSDVVTNSPTGAGVMPTTLGPQSDKIFGGNKNSGSPAAPASGQINTQIPKPASPKTCPTCASITELPPSATERIERYPVIECPDKVVVANRFVVQVSLALLPPKTPAAVTEGQKTPEGKISMGLPRQMDQAPWKIEVVLSAPDFEFVDGKNAQTIDLPALKKSTIARFTLKPKAVAQLPVPADLNATLWHGGNFLGQISRTITISRGDEPENLPVDKTKPGTQNNNESSPTGQPVKDALEQSQSIKLGSLTNPPKSVPQNMAAPKGSASTEANAEPERPATSGAAQPSDSLLPPIMRLDPEQKSPDLTILIKERFNMRSTGQVEIQIHSPHLQTTTDHKAISPEVSQWLEARFKEFSEKSGRDLKMVEAGTNYKMNKYAEGMMVGFGKELYKKIAPDIFKVAFWKLQDKLKAKFTSIKIISDNPTIPWELMIPVRNDGKDERGFFLGERFNVGRWHLPEGSSLLENPPQALNISQLSVIAPEYSGEQKLHHQPEELKVLGQLPGYRFVGGRLSIVQKFFASSPQGIIHFAGHGGSLRASSKINDYAILLEDGPLNVQTWQGLVPQKLSAHPFLFFNACHIGQAQRVANFVNGWAPALLEAGASGYIGALWPINDRGAYDFAKTFYGILDAELKRGPVTIAEVLRRTRQTFLNNSDPTFLAYVYYGDPNLTFYSPQPERPPTVNRKKP
ncbi:MAG TPA: CsgG/HfaB family protein [Blastocatellia bacterium]